MNLEESHQEGKEVSAVNLFKGATGGATAIRLAKDGVLKEHTTKVPAVLICVSGFTIYNDENGRKIELHTGDFVHIDPEVKHALYAPETSHLILIK